MISWTFGAVAVDDETVGGCAVDTEVVGSDCEPGRADTDVVTVFDFVGLAPRHTVLVGVDEAPRAAARASALTSAQGPTKSTRLQVTPAGASKAWEE